MTPSTMRAMAIPAFGKPMQPVTVPVPKIGANDVLLRVRATGEQGSGILRSMSEANCFIILPTDQGNVAAGSMVDVQVMEGVV